MMGKMRFRVRRFYRYLLPLLLFALLLPAFRAKAAPEPVTTVRIGLYYGDGAMEACNLLNAVGSGYELGYFDEKREFVALGYTDETAITMLKDWSMYLVEGSYSSDTPKAGEAYQVVGCYHIRLGSYESFETAREVAAAYEDGFPAWHNGEYLAMAGSYTSFAEAESAMEARGIGGTPMTGSNRCVTVVNTGSTRVLFQFDGGEALSLGVMPRGEEDAAPVTWFRGYRYAGGFQYSRLEGDRITVVNFVEMDDYIRGVVPYEMNPGWPLEALKAQAITARTYTAAHLNAHRSYGFDLCGQVCCQTYKGLNNATENSDRAVLETAGIYMTYEGEYANTFYHSCDGGATENSENVFYEEIPYLRGVADPYESHVETGFENWSFVYTADEITAILRSKNYNCGKIVSVTPVYTELGNIYSLKFTDDNGKNWTFSRDRAGSILYSSAYEKYTYSQRFTVSDADAVGTELFVNNPSGRVEDAGALAVLDASGTVRSLGEQGSVCVLSASGTETVSLDGSGAAIAAQRYLISGSGWGHNVGMSQYGAKAMAELGFSCEEILSFYFNGVDIG